MPAAAGAYGIAAPSGVKPEGAGNGYGGMAAQPPSVSIQDLVLKFFQSKGEASDAGCTINEAAAALGVNGVSEAQVRSHVDELVQEGHLYSTIDDDHFKATA